MKNKRNRVLAGILAVASMTAFSACGGGDDSGGSGGDATSAAADTTTTTTATEWTGDNIEVTVAEDSVEDVDISGQKLKWMSNYDLNPTNASPERSVELAIFEDTYGAGIEYTAVAYGEMYDKLATSVLSGDAPDIFIYDTRTFPYDISKGMYQPIDDLIDFNDPLWADMKDTADMLTWNGQHYVAPLTYRFNDYVILMYDKTKVEELGIDDPYELYEQDQWDWDNFIRVMEEFQGGDPSLYGISGYWAQLFVFTAGEPMVTWDGKQFSNNLYSAKIEKAQNVIKRIKNEGLINPADWINPDAAFTTGDTMFYGMGTWAYQGAADAVPDDVIQIVPFPKDPDSSDYYMSKIIFSYMWVKGSDKADAVKVWLNINRQVNTEPEYIQANKEKFLANNSAWTEEMYDIVYSYSDDSKFKLAYEYGSGISDVMTGDNGHVRQLYDSIYKGTTNLDLTAESWEQIREEYVNIFDEEIAEINSVMAAAS